MPSCVRECFKDCKARGQSTRKSPAGGQSFRFCRTKRGTRLKLGKSTRALELLATSVIRGETTEFPWTVLRQTYFAARSNRGASRQLAQWAAAHGIGVIIEHRPAIQHDSETEWIRFTRGPSEAIE